MLYKKTATGKNQNNGKNTGYATKGKSAGRVETR